MGIWPLRLGSSWIAAALGVVVSPAVSPAAVTIGPSVEQAPGGGLGCGSSMEAGTCSGSTLSGGAPIASPMDGVVVRWRVASPDAFTKIAPTFRILRNVGGFTGVGSSGPIPAFAGVGQFDTRLPIRTGDRIGVDLPPIMGPCAGNCIGWVTGGTTDSWSPPLGDGESPGRGPTGSTS